MFCLFALSKRICIEALIGNKIKEEGYALCTVFTVQSERQCFLLERVSEQNHGRDLHVGVDSRGTRIFGQGIVDQVSIIKEFSLEWFNFHRPTMKNPVSWI